MYTRILVAIDGSPTSSCGLDEAINLAKDQKAQLRILHVVDEAFIMYDQSGWSGTVIDSLMDGGARLLADAAGLASSRGVPAETGLKETMAQRVADKILEEAAAWKADLIVMGTHGRRGVSRLVMGSDAEAVLHAARVPVLLVKSLPVATARSEPQQAGLPSEMAA